MVNIRLSTRPEESERVTRWTVTDDEGREGEIVYTRARPEKFRGESMSALAFDKGRDHKPLIQPIDPPDFETARRAVLAMLADETQEPEQSSESDETESAQELAPATRGRVVARWEHVSEREIRLVAGMFEILVSPTGYVRLLVGPFGGELVVEGEP